MDFPNVVISIMTLPHLKTSKDELSPIIALFTMLLSIIEEEVLVFGHLLGSSRVNLFLLEEG